MIESLSESPIERDGRRGDEQPPRWSGKVYVSLYFGPEDQCRSAEEAMERTAGMLPVLDNLLVEDAEPDQDPAEPDGAE